MTTDTTPGADHAAAIRTYAEGIRDNGYTVNILAQTSVALRVDHIIRRSDALAAALAAERERAARLREALIEEAKHALAFGDERIPLNVPDEEALHVLRECNSMLQPGDLDPAPPARADRGA